MKLHAISDLHLGYEQNRKALSEIQPAPDDWLILAGDVGETLDHLELAIRVLKHRFCQLVWVPGNHELWTLPSRGERLRGEAKYHRFVDLCRAYNVLTPEDPYQIATFCGVNVRIAPLFLLYDYSFRPPYVAREDAVGWAREAGVYCADEELLHADPFSSLEQWCAARCSLTEARLRGCEGGPKLILINHFPLRQDLIWLPRIPRFSIWCGTTRTEDWHVRFNAIAVVSGHLHIPSTTYRDGVRFDEVSFGYPSQRRQYTTINDRVREILPGLQARDT